MRRREGSAAAGSGRRGERLLALVVAGILAFNFPLLGLLGGSGTLFGIPAPFVYLYVVWAVFIGLVAACLGTGARRDRDSARNSRSD